jgi:hypothetical protein
MTFGQIVNIVEYKVTDHNERYDYTLEMHLNEIGKQGWFLHTIKEKEIDQVLDDDTYKVIVYHCVWQRITQNIPGIIS